MELFAMSKTKTSRKAWRQHLVNFSNSGLSGAEYCRQNNLDYPQFLYWRVKYSQVANASEHTALAVMPSNDFVPVNIPVSAEKPEVSDVSHILCSVEFFQGHRLVIHSRECLKSLPEILRVACNYKSSAQS